MVGKKGEVVGHVELGRILGVGGFGQVRLGYDRKADQQVAVKVIDKFVVKQNKLESYVKREVEVLRKIKHKHVVQLTNMIEDSKGYYLIMELAPNGELFDKIVESRRFDEPTARRYFQQLMSAVAYCHKKDVVHRDIKAENLLLGPAGELKVCDFGLSRYVLDAKNKDHPVMFTSLAGSTDYQAPEVLKSEGYHGFTCDVWSCGVILFFMLCGYLPFAARTEKETRERILAGAYNKKDKYLSPLAQDLLSKVLVVDPNSRFSTDDIIAHPWFVVDLDPALFPEATFPRSISSQNFLTPDGCGGSFTNSNGSGGGGGHSPMSAGSPVTAGSPNDMPLSAEAAEKQQADSLELLKRAFLSCNVNKTGMLDHDEVRDVMIKLNNGQPVPESEVDDLYLHFSKDKTTPITMEQFVSGWMQHKQYVEGKLELTKLVDIFHVEVEQQLIAELRKAFDTLDIDHSGIITAHNICQLPELQLNEEEAQRLIEAMDMAKHCAKGLTFEDFVLCATKCDLLTRHPLGRRLKRVEKMFDVFEQYSGKQFFNTGFTVAGLREVILGKIVKEQAAIRTTFRKSDEETSLYVYGSHEDPEGRRIEVGVQLLPAVTGYTKVLAYRIAGKTEVFHEWYLSFRKMLRQEILQCEEDTFPVGEAELM